MNIFDYNATGIEGEPIDLARYQGQALLIVNTASDCGFTPQYQGLEQLWRQFRDRGVTVLGFPCNQFGGQEPGDEAAIGAFCEKNYGVSFPLFAKIDVNGANVHPLFAQLKKAAPGLLGTEAVKWNFTKFLVAKDGNVVKRYAPSTKPEALSGDIENLLAQQ